MSAKDAMPEIRGSVRIHRTNGGTTPSAFQTSYKFKHTGEGIRATGPFLVIANQQLQAVSGMAATIGEIAVSGAMHLSLHDKTVELSGEMTALGDEAFYRLQEKITRLADLAAVICTLCKEVVLTFSVETTCQIIKS